MSKLVWDQIGEKLYETGVEQAAIYVMGTDNKFGVGVPWNGLTAVTESPSGAEPTALYANNKKYLELMSKEELGGTIEAYMYPDAFAECNGESSIVPGITVSQQTRKLFCMVYKTLIGNDTVGDKYGYKLNIVYNMRVSPSEKANNSINESPEVDPFSWEFTTTPVEMEGYDATSKITIDSTKVAKDKLAELEAKLYGSEESEATLLLPNEIVALVGDAVAEG